MAEDIITKRLHVSGLTSSITPSELSRRLSSFGTVKNLDGFGTLDGLGQPRKFGYVTIEGSRGQLAKCVNVLSGATWKGTKLRIGDAKPDYRERLAKERKSDLEPPKKKRKQAFAGTHAEDMSLVTPSNAASHSGWKVTTMGRMIRPVRMRPEKPLPPPTPIRRIAKSKIAKDGKDKEKKKRVREPDSRARRRTIDPTRWDSVHLKGMFLDVISAPPDEGGRSMEKYEGKDGSISNESNDTTSDEDDSEAGASGTDIQPTTKPFIDRSTPIQPTPPGLSSPSPPPISLSKLPELASHYLPTDLAAEKNTSLSLIHSLFGDKQDEWDRQESLGSEIDEKEIEKLKREGMRSGVSGAGGAEDEFEEVPMEVDRTSTSTATATEEGDEEVAENEMVTEQKKTSLSSRGSTPAVEPAEGRPTQIKKLKDLFAPREEEAGFSLLGHLDLDLELDDDTDIPNFINTAPEGDTEADIRAATIPVTVHSTLQTHAASRAPASQFTYDPTLPLFFPIIASQRANARQKDVFSIAQERGWDPLSAKFYRTQTEDEIRQRWQEQKGELTRDWKRRVRDASKMKRRRGGGDVE